MVQTTGQLRDQGVDGDQLRRLSRTGEVVRVRHGVYDSEPAELKPIEAHRRLIAATVPLLGEDAVLSHSSAAVLHGMPVPVWQLDRVWVTRQSSGGGHLSPQLHEYKARFREEDVVEVDGLRVTRPERTAVDLARRVGLGYGLAAADSALRTGADLAALDEQVALWPRRPGMRKARTVVALADGDAESYGESVSRLLMWQLGLARPVLQPRLIIGGRRFRADFGWPEFGVLGEFDGRVKYDELLKPGESAADVIMAEKAREQLLQSLHWYVVRWGMADLRDPQGFRRLLLAAFANGRPASLTA
jgi:hypothetical protein